MIWYIGKLLLLLFSVPENKPSVQPEELFGQWQGIYTDYGRENHPYPFILDSITCSPSSFDYSDSSWSYVVKGIVKINSNFFPFSGILSHNSLVSYIYEDKERTKGFTFLFGDLKSENKESGDNIISISGLAYNLNNSSKIFTSAKQGKYILSKKVVSPVSKTFQSPVKEGSITCEQIQGDWKGIYVDFESPDASCSFAIDSLGCGKKTIVTKDSSWSLSFTGVIQNKNNKANFWGDLHLGIFGGAIHYDNRTNLTDALYFRSDQIKVEVSEDSLHTFLVISGYGRLNKYSNDTSTFFPGATFGRFILSKQLK